MLEVLESTFVVDLLLVTSHFFKEHLDLLSERKLEIIQIKKDELGSIGSLKSNDSALAVVQFKKKESFSILPNEWVLALDEIKDPSNLGSILRIADWYGIYKVLLSPTSADFYNPKVIQSTMGSFTRVNVFYTDLEDTLKEIEVPVYGAYLHGENVHQAKFTSGGVLLVGNESRGISSSLNSFVTKRISIPKYGLAESLNVAMATSILCDNIRRS